MNYLANSLTILSLFSGFLSIIFSLRGHFTFACWAIILSVIFDGLDGQVARLNPIPSNFGKELDSLVDVVAFGIAPAMLGYIYIYRTFYLWATPALFIYLLCSIMRLAKYNVTPKEAMSVYFYGLPTTVSGGVLASFILIYRRKTTFVLPEYLPAIFILIVLILSFLMISRVRYLNLDGLRQLLGRNIFGVIFVLALSLAVAAVFRKAGIAISAVFLIYLIFSPFVVKSLYGPVGPE